MPLTKRGGWSYGHPPNTQFTLNRQSPQSRGLVAWWPMIGDRGASTVRNYGRSLDGTYAAGQVSGPSTWGTLPSFDAGGGYVDITGFSGTGGIWTFSAWMNSTTASNNQYLADFQTGRLVIAHAANVASISYYDGGWHDIAAAVADSEWHLETWVLNGPANLGIIYRDAVSLGSDTYSGANPGGAASVIGARYNGSQAQAFLGFMADIRIYNRALSAAEVWAMYDPATRWELYAPVMPQFYVLAPAGGWPFSPVWQGRGVVGSSIVRGVR